jgi:lysophospholipase L1-like esterase
MPETTMWIASWSAPVQLCEEHNLPPPPGLEGHVLTQIFRVSLGGKGFRLRFSNLFGDSRLVLESLNVSFVDDEGLALPGPPLSVRFGGRDRLELEPGREATSDAVDAPIRAFDRIALRCRVAACPKALTSQTASRTGSFIDDDVRFEHWYFITGLETLTQGARGAIACLGDSITGGRGVTIDRDRRWTDVLSRRVAADPELNGVSVLNSGLGGNRIMADGLGPSATSRLERDSAFLLGARWLILFEGVNDIGTRSADESPSAFIGRLLYHYRAMIARSRRAGLRIFGGTISPFGGAGYGSPENLEVRRIVNRWIRESGEFDGVIDFDAAVRDPADPERVRDDCDSGDHLHLNDTGYRALGEAVDLGLFKERI